MRKLLAAFLVAALALVSVAEAAPGGRRALLSGGARVPSWVPSKFASANLYVGANHQNSDGTYCTGWFRKTGQVKPCSRFLTRTGTGGTAFDTAGNVVPFVGTALRATNAGLTTEEARTNSATNNSMTGAVAGTPGTNPTGWTVSNNLSTQIVGIGTVQGLPYIDIRFFGTPTVTSAQVIGAGTVSGSAAQVWTNSGYIALVGGSFTNVSSMTLRAASESGGTVFTPDATLTRRTNTMTLTGTLATWTLRWNYSNTTTPVDFTLRIAGNQTELGSFATTPILTTNVAVTRAQDFISFSDVSWLSQEQGMLYVAHTPEGFTSTPRIFGLYDGTINNAAEMFAPASNAGFQVQVGGATQFQATGAAQAVGLLSKIAATFSAAGGIMAVNGVLGAAQSGTFTIPTFTSASIGNRPDGSRPENGTITELASSLSNSQLQALTQ